jgi:DNA-binding transcriptional regulator YhcF (GntR family)
MQIHISKQSDVPVREQIAQQIIFQIATEDLKPGEVLPSVRALARRLKIHHNTVSRVYSSLVRRSWLAHKKGSRVIVRPQDEFTRITRVQNLDSMINAVIRVARDGGHSLQELRDRVRQRMLEQPPDHVLVIEDDEGLRELLEREIGTFVRWPLRGCSRAQLRDNRGLLVGALPVVAQHHLPDIASLLPRTRPAIPVTYCVAEEQLAVIGRLRESSIVAIVSVSQVFLKTARGLLAPILENHHTLCELLWPSKRASEIRAADLVFCDSIAFDQVVHPKRVPYRLVVPSALEYIANAMESYRKEHARRSKGKGEM